VTLDAPDPDVTQPDIPDQTHEVLTSVAPHLDVPETRTRIIAAIAGPVVTAALTNIANRIEHHDTADQIVRMIHNERKRWQQ